MNLKFDRTASSTEGIAGHSAWHTDQLGIGDRSHEAVSRCSKATREKLLLSSSRIYNYHG